MSACDGYETSGEGLRVDYIVDQTGLHPGKRRIRFFRGLRRLHDRDAAGFLEGFQGRGSVAVQTRQGDGNSRVSALRQGTQENRDYVGPAFAF